MCVTSETNQTQFHYNINALVFSLFLSRTVSLSVCMSLQLYEALFMFDCLFQSDSSELSENLTRGLKNREN